MACKTGHTIKMSFCADCQNETNLIREMVIKPIDDDRFRLTVIDEAGTVSDIIESDLRFVLNQVIQLFHPNSNDKVRKVK